MNKQLDCEGVDASGDKGKITYVEKSFGSFMADGALLELIEWIQETQSEMDLQTKTSKEILDASKKTSQSNLPDVVAKSLLLLMRASVPSKSNIIHLFIKLEPLSHLSLVSNHHNQYDVRVLFGLDKCHFLKF